MLIIPVLEWKASDRPADAFDKWAVDHPVHRHSDPTTAPSDRWVHAAAAAGAFTRGGQCSAPPQSVLPIVSPRVPISIAQI
jgi:hypothetical protein